MKYASATVAVLGLALTALPLQAAPLKANDVVSVDVSNVANDLAVDLDVAAEDITALGTVQVPVGVAATVCDVDANVLAQQKGDEGGAACEAQSTSQALSQMVKKQLASAQ